MKKRLINRLVLNLVGYPGRTSLLISLPITLVLCVLVISFTLWNNAIMRRDLMLTMAESGRAYFGQIMVTRLWNARHGGVYVEVTDKTKPNPYLTEDPMRDIVTVEGRQFTKINPAYMTRQISAIAQDLGVYKFHITSLKPLNPDNRPDVWESVMLKEFEQGKTEGYTLIGEKNKIFKYMAPLLTTEECLQCHASQGYKVGDVRGGISVSIPMNLQSTMFENEARRGMFLFITMGATVFLIVVTMVWFFGKRLAKSLTIELEAEKLDSAIKMADAAAHELRQPMTVVSGLSELLADHQSSEAETREYTSIIVDQCKRMNAIIEKMVNVTNYRTKSYDEFTEIFDIDPDENKNDKK